MTKIKTIHLRAAEQSELRQGSWGYGERDICGANRKLRAEGDAIVVREANRLGWTLNELVAWVDSKYGRWFWDSLYGCSDPEGAARLVTLDWMTASERADYGL